MAGKITLFIIKPNAVLNGHIGPILSQIGASGFHFAAMKLTRLDRHEAERFYAVHRDRPFYSNLVNFMISGPVVVGILEKENAVTDYRRLMGATDPAKAEEGTIRKRFAENIERNAVHGSDSDENALVECDFFFSKSERYYRSEDL